MPAFVVSAHSHLAAVAVRGQGAAPLVRLDGPGGLTATIPAGRQIFSTPSVSMIANPGDGTTYIYLSHPPSGTYTVTPLPGSAPVRALDFAQPLANPSVTASGRASGCVRRLRWRLTPVPGQRVFFYERGADQRLLTSTNAASGSVVYTPATGQPAERTIVGVVEQEGTPRGTFVLARYKTATDLPPAGVQRVRVARRGNRVQVSWAPACGASGYVVELAGRRSRRRLDVKGTRVSSGVVSGSVTISVRPYGFTGLLGPGRSRRTG